MSLCPSSGRGGRHSVRSIRRPARRARNRTGEDNADARKNPQVIGREVVVAITTSKLDFGRWQQIFYGEFDVRRPKRVLVKVIGE